MQANKIINKLIESYRDQDVAGSNMILQMQQKHILSILSDKQSFYGAEICGLGITYAQKSFHLIENGNSTKEAISFLNLSLMYSEVGLGVKLDSFKKIQRIRLRYMICKNISRSILVYCCGLS